MAGADTIPNSRQGSALKSIKLKAKPGSVINYQAQPKYSGALSKIDKFKVENNSDNL